MSSEENDILFSALSEMGDSCRQLIIDVGDIRGELMESEEIANEGIQAFIQEIQEIEDLHEEISEDIRSEYSDVLDYINNIPEVN